MKRVLIRFSDALMAGRSEMVKPRECSTSNAQRPTFNSEAPRPHLFFIRRWTLDVGRWTFSSIPLPPRQRRHSQCRRLAKPESRSQAERSTSNVQHPTFNSEAARPHLFFIRRWTLGVFFNTSATAPAPAIRSAAASQSRNRAARQNVQRPTFNIQRSIQNQPGGISSSFDVGR
jgi:hypothetical protein